MARDNFFSFLDHLTYVQDDSSSYEVEIGDNGFSYLNMVSEKKTRRITFEEKQRRDTSAALDGSTRAHGKLNIRQVETVDHDEICLDTDLSSILRDIAMRRKKMSFFPFAASAVGILFLLWLMSPLMFEGTLLAVLFMGVTAIVLVPCSFVVLWNVWKLDISRKHVKFAYNITGKGKDAFESINGSLAALSHSKSVMLYSGRKLFEDTRYSGGAASLPDLKPVKIQKSKPPLLDLDFQVWHMRAFHTDLFFMPDHVLIFDGARTGGINYAQLEIEGTAEKTQARDQVSVASDSKVVGSTYRFVNNDGTPDHRFNNNIQISIVELGVFKLAGAGLDISLYASNQQSATSAPSGFDEIRTLASKPVRKVAEERKSRSRERTYSALLDAMCCIMVADGQASAAEKSRIQEAMQKVGAPWAADDIDARVCGFIQRVKDGQYNRMLTETCEKVKLFKNLGKGDVLLRCLESVARSDGQVDEKERKVYERLKASLT